MSVFGVSGVDHLVVKVRDLDRAREVYGRLGFKLTLPARHPGIGTSNLTAVFSNQTYFEFLAIDDPKTLSSPYDVLCDAREGLAAVALKTSDAREAYHRLADAGMRPGKPVDIVRPVFLPEGSGEARFTMTPLPREAFPGGAVFACQQHSPDSVWQSDYLTHENGAVGIGALVVAADNPEDAAGAYAGLLKAAKREVAAGAFVVDAKPCPILVGQPATLRWAWSADPLFAEERPFLAGAVVVVEDLYRAQQALQKSRMPVICSEGMLRVTSQHTLGVMLAFTADLDFARLLP